MITGNPANCIPGLRTLRNMYAALEDNLVTPFRYVEPSRDNPKVYSIEFLRLLQAACAGIDSAFSLWYSCLTRKDAQTELRRIPLDRRKLPHYFPLLEILLIETDEELVLLRDRSKPIMPFWGWKGQTGIPAWWTAHNMTKHHLDRISFKQAALWNAVHALGGFYLTLNDLETRKTNPVSTLVFKALF
jgi:hypothetical protein